MITTLIPNAIIKPKIFFRSNFLSDENKKDFNFGTTPKIVKNINVNENVDAINNNTFPIIGFAIKLSKEISITTIKNVIV
jgi:hypothetical protein